MSSNCPRLMVSILSLNELASPTMIDPAELNRPLKKILNEQKYNYLTSDPENHVGHDLIR